MAKSPICLDKLFTGRQFEREVIVLCVRWYLRFKPSFLDLIEMMAERGLSLAHTTIMRWVQGFAPEFVHRWNRFVRQQAIPGALMRPISRSVASGRIFSLSRRGSGRQDCGFQTECPSRCNGCQTLFPEGAEDARASSSRHYA
jgi:hypothetical protein